MTQPRRSKQSNEMIAFTKIPTATKQRNSSKPTHPTTTKSSSLPKTTNELCGKSIWRFCPSSSVSRLSSETPFQIETKAAYKLTVNNAGVYFLQSLDKTALSYAAVFGLIEHTNLVNDEYSWLGAIVYVAQLVWQPVVAYFLVKLPTGKFLASMVFCW